MQSNKTNIIRTSIIGALIGVYAELLNSVIHNFDHTILMQIGPILFDIGHTRAFLVIVPILIYAYYRFGFKIMIMSLFLFESYHETLFNIFYILYYYQIPPLDFRFILWYTLIFFAFAMFGLMIYGRMIKITKVSIPFFIALGILMITWTHFGFQVSQGIFPEHLTNIQLANDFEFAYNCILGGLFITTVQLDKLTHKSNPIICESCNQTIPNRAIIKQTLIWIFTASLKGNYFIQCPNCLQFHIGKRYQDKPVY